MKDEIRIPDKNLQFSQASAYLQYLAKHNVAAIQPGRCDCRDTELNEDEEIECEALPQKMRLLVATESRMTYKN
jgi:hypothetical protein